MKRILKILALVVILTAIWYQFGDTIRARFVTILNGIVAQIGIGDPCKEPIVYTFGTFDTKFGISKSYFLDAIKEAEMIWEKPFGKELFDYSGEGTADMLKINLVYDYRQQATSTLADIGITVKENRASYDSLKIKFTEFKADLAAAKSNYEARVKSFNDRQEDYEERVEYWNARGGAPRGEYEELQAEKTLLNEEVSQLKTLQTKISSMVDDINAMVVVLNRLASALNISVDKYNTVTTSRGESFEEGVYSSDGSNREIDIYEFSSRSKLVRVLAHEFGHALSLEHVDDPKAIMYKLNQGNSATLTQTDLAALKAKCQVE